MKELREWLSLLGVIWQELLNLVFYDPIVWIVSKRVSEIRHEAEVEFFEKGYKHGQQAMKDELAAERGVDPNTL